MEKEKTRPMTFRTSEEIRADFKATFEASGATSQNEFLGMLLKKWINPETILQPVAEAEPKLTEEETQEIFKTSFEASDSRSPEEFFDQLLSNFNELKENNEPEPVKKELKENEILITLTPAQMVALHEVVTSKNNFAEDQNEIIDSLDYKKPENHYYGLISEPEFNLIWVRNLVLSEEMPQDEKESAIKHNMAAFLVNMFFTHFIQGKIETTDFDPRKLRAFIQGNTPDCHVRSEQPTQLSDIKENEILLCLTPAQMFALREMVLSKTDFAEKQNEIFDSLKPENKPFLYFGNLFDPEFNSIWVRNLVLSEEMPQDEKESAIKHNMAAFLVNMFLMHLIEGKIKVSKFKSDDLKKLLQAQNQEIEQETEINS